MISQGLVVFAGMVSLPVAVTLSGGSAHTQRVPAPDYRQDPRFHSIRAFFEKFGCPAREYAHVFLEAADDYNLDWRLLPSLSWVESTGGKFSPNNNLFGWDSGRASFRTPAASIHMVGFRLAYSSLYRDKALDQLLMTYNPSAEYAARVKSVMRRIAPLE